MSCELLKAAVDAMSSQSVAFDKELVWSGNAWKSVEVSAPVSQYVFMIVETTMSDVPQTYYGTSHGNSSVKLVDSGGNENGTCNMLNGPKFYASFDMENRYITAVYGLVPKQQTI